jgi:cytochrome P450
MAIPTGTSYTVVLNSIEAVHELLERRSARYSDRPPNVMAQQLRSGGLSVPLTRYGALFRKQRRAFGEAFAKAHLPQYDPIIAGELANLLARLARVPDTPEGSTAWIEPVSK